jgi:hypothetical protein
MPTRQLSDEVLIATVEAYKANNRSWLEAAKAIGVSRCSIGDRLKQAAKRGLLLDHPPAMPGFEVTKVATDPNGGQHITQKLEHGDVFEMPKTHFLGKMTVQRDPEGRVVQDWIRVMPDEAAREAAIRAVIHGLCSDLPREERVTAAAIIRNDDLLNQYTVTDLHFGKLAWGEETGSDYDMKIAEQLLLDWFAMAIRLSPNAGTRCFPAAAPLARLRRGAAGGFGCGYSAFIMRCASPSRVYTDWSRRQGARLRKTKAAAG